MKIQTLVLGPLDTNCYLVSDSLTQECLIIDPADDAEAISEEILRQQLKPKALIATHGHYDHIMAASTLQLNFDLAFMIHQDDEFLVKKLAESASYWQKIKLELQSPKITNYLKDSQTLTLGQETLTVMHVPGHTPGGICLIDHQAKIVFSGDTLFADAVGRTDLSYSQPKKMKQSLQKIRQELSGYQGYPGHGRGFVV